MKLDGVLLRKMIMSAAEHLHKHKDLIDSLNVFPVPDGDTGTNMSLTVLSAARELENVVSDNASEVAKAAALGALKGARGNSGVILSQLFRGFAKGLENVQTVGLEDLAIACAKASDMAYKAVMKPKEGTILTLSREIAYKISEEIYNYNDIEQVMQSTIIYGKKVLDDTMEMLPQLKQAGVVDSGACGLLFMLEGAMHAVNVFGSIELENVKPRVDLSADIEFQYCTELLFTGTIDEDATKEYLSSIGDSIVVVVDEDTVKFHVHTNNPGLVIEYALRFGELEAVKIDNLKIQHSEQFTPKKDVGYVAVAMGEGFIELFKNLGADVVIEGGQTMNPSIEDLSSAIRKVNAETVFVLPNNKNITLAANQAAELFDDRSVVVLPTQNMPQGISVLINNGDDVEQTLNNIQTGQITYAVRDTKIGEQDVKLNDILCLQNGELVFANEDMMLAAEKLVDMLMEKNGQLMTIYFGSDTDETAAQKIADYAKNAYPDLEIEVYNGGQPVYYFIISVE